MRKFWKTLTATLLAVVLALMPLAVVQVNASAPLELGSAGITASPDFIAAGGSTTVVVPVRSTASSDIGPITVSLNAPGMTGGSSVTINSIPPGGTDTATFNLSASATASSGTVDISASASVSYGGTNQSTSLGSTSITVFNPGDIGNLPPGFPPTPPPPPEPPPPPGAPNIRLLSPQNITAAPGETAEVTIQVRNIGAESAHGLLTQATTAVDGPFTIEFLRNTNNVASLGSNSNRNMTMRISVDAGAAPGAHTINLAHHFRNEAGAGFSTNDSLPLRIAGVAAAPDIRLFNFAAPVQPRPGGNFNVTATLENTGEAAATDIQFTIAAENIFLINAPTITNLTGSNHQNISFELTAGSNLSPGFHTIEFRVAYRDGAGRTQTRYFPFFVNVGDPGRGILEVRNINASTARISPGGTGTISFDIVNSGDYEARNVLVAASPDAALAPTTASSRVIPVLAPGATYHVSFSFTPRETAETRNYLVRFDVSFDTRGQAGAPFFLVEGINVHNPDVTPAPDEGQTQIARVIIEEFSLYPQIPLAGQEFDMEITFLNTNRTRGVNNIRVTIEADVATGQGVAHGSVFIPVGGSNTLFIDELPPLGSVTRILRFFTVPDAEPRSYGLTVNFDYQEDDTYITRTPSERISIPVAQVTRLETDGLQNLPSHVSSGEMVWFDFRVMNTGRVDLRNVRARMEAPWDTTEATFPHIGPLRQQQSINLSGRFTPFEEGTFTAAIIIYGEDATGAIVESVHEFTIEVMPGWGGGGFGDPWDDPWMEGGGFRDPWFEGGDDPFYGMVWCDETFQWIEAPSEGGFLNFIRRPIVWGPAAGVLVVIIIVTAVIISKKRSKLDFDDED